MKILRHIFLAGKTIVIREQPTREIEKGRKRAPKKNLTSEEVWKNNLKNAIFKLTLILNSNFIPGDHHLQLTYAKEPTAEQGKKDRQKFVRKLREECRKEDIEVKWVAVSEHKGKRLHHHIICTGVPMRIIEKCWPHGIVFHNPLWDNPNYKGLAEYLLKEAAKDFEEAGEIGKRRYNCSRNIKVPEPKKQELSRVDLEKDPVAFKDYYIDGEVERYEHAITRLTCREYILVPLTDEPRIKYWPKGVTGKLEKINYTRLLRGAYTEHQEELDVFCAWEE